MKLKGMTHIALAKASPMDKEYFDFARRLHARVFERLIRPVVEVVSPDLVERFASPEMATRPTTKNGGGKCYVAYSSLRDYELSVELTKTPQIAQVEASVLVRNPFSEKREAVIDTAVREVLDSEQWSSSSKTLAAKVGFGLMRDLKQSVEDSAQLFSSQLAQLEGQSKFYRSLLSAVKSMDSKGKQK